MSSGSKIEWTDATYNPVVGCSPVSPGCENCYAARIAVRLGGNPATPQYEGTARSTPAGARWTGTVNFVPAMLDRPLRWQKPRRIFVNSMSDTFHPDVSFAQIVAILGVALACPLHTMQLLTKRPERAVEFYGWISERGGLGKYIRSDEGAEALRPIFHHFDATHYETVYGRWQRTQAHPWMKVINAAACEVSTVAPHNVWLGVSVEDQPTADERIPHLLQCPAAVRWVSYEPALGPLELSRLHQHCPTHDFAGGFCSSPCPDLRSIDWLVAGGESGPGARPAHPQWFRDVRDQCAAAGVAFFFKQWGAWAPAVPGVNGAQTRYVNMTPADAGSFAWPMNRVGKKAAGRLLDGREHNEFPNLNDPEAR